MRGVSPGTHLSLLCAACPQVHTFLYFARRVPRYTPFFTLRGVSPGTHLSLLCAACPQVHTFLYF